MLQRNNFRSRYIQKCQNSQQFIKNRQLKASKSFYNRRQADNSKKYSKQSSICKSAIVYDNKINKIAYEYNICTRRQIASLTKIMTCFLALKFIDEQGVSPENIQFDISKEASQLRGTSSSLEQGFTISLWDLLHGLMLPSGNDAALCIAQNVGKGLLKSDNKQQISKIYGRLKNKDNKYCPQKPINLAKQCQQAFIRIMNKTAKQLGMNNSRYNNPHGLSDSQNYSTVEDQLILIKQCLKFPLFKKIVSTKLYFGCMKSKHQIWTHQVIWENTNRLLSHKFKGIKTGNTLSAGFCLASWYCCQNTDIVAIILGCNSKQQRDSHTLSLVKQYIDKIENIERQNKQS